MYPKMVVDQARTSTSLPEEAPMDVNAIKPETAETLSSWTPDINTATLRQHHVSFHLLYHCGSSETVRGSNISAANQLPLTADMQLQQQLHHRATFADSLA